MKNYFNKNKTRLISGMIFFAVALACYLFDHTTGVIMATVAAATPDIFDKIKDQINGLKIEDETQKNALIAQVEEAKKNGVKFDFSEVVTYLKSIDETGKNALKPAESKIIQPWYRHLLIGNEASMTDEKEAKRIAFNRHLLSMTGDFVDGKYSGREDVVKAIAQYKNAFQTEGTTTAGGYTVPVQTLSLIADDIRDSGIAMSETRVIPMSLPVVKLPILETVGANLYATYNVPVPAYCVEGAAKAVSNYTFDIVTFTMKKYAFITPFTEELLDDSASDLEGYLRQGINDYYGILMDNLLFRGDGQITGLYGLTTSFQVTGATFSTLVIDDLINAIGLLRSVDMKDVKWYMSPSVWASLHTKKNLQDSYLLSEYDIKSRTLLGIPVVLTDSAYAMGETAVSRPFITLCNMKKVILGLRKAISLARSTEASFLDGATQRSAFQDNLVLFRAEARFDIETPFPLRIVQIKTAAA